MSQAAIDPRIYDRLRWRARRGLLENDILLGRFFDAELMKLSENELGLLDRLLRVEDNDLLDYLLGKKACQDEQLVPLIQKIRSVRPA